MSAATSLLLAFLPTDAADFIRDNILHPRSSFQLLASQAIGFTRQAVSTASPYLQSALDRAGVDVSGVDLSRTLAATVLAMVVFAAVNYVVRTVLWWTRFTFRILWWVAILAAGAWVWENGVFESARDAVVLGGNIFGYMAGVKDVWVAEYQRYENQEQQQHRQYGFGGGGRGGSSGRY